MTDAQARLNERIAKLKEGGTTPLSPEQLRAKTVERQRLESEAKKAKIPAVRRGTHRRRARAQGMHMSTFWQLSDSDREMTHAISRAGRRPQPRLR